MGYLDLARQAAVTTPPARPPRPTGQQHQSPGRFLRLARGLAAEQRAQASPGDGPGTEAARADEREQGSAPRRGATEQSLWRRALALARALSGRNPGGLYEALLLEHRRGTRLLAGEEHLHLVADEVGQARLRRHAAQLEPLLAGLARDREVASMVILGDLPPLREYLQPQGKCFCCGATTWRQRGDGGWVCGVCHPDTRPSYRTNEERDR